MYKKQRVCTQSHHHSFLSDNIYSSGGRSIISESQNQTEVTVISWLGVQSVHAIRLASFGFGYSTDVGCCV